MGYIAKPNVRRGTEVKKGWGKEIIIENNDQYCGKLLIFNKGCRIHYISLGFSIQAIEIIMFP